MTDTCPTCGVADRSTMTHCSDGFYAPGETYWPTLTVDDRELIELAQQRDDEMCHELADRLQSLLSDVGRLSEAATKARDKFLHYEDLHRTKCTAEGDEKADRNREMADMLTVALIQTEVP